MVSLPSFPHHGSRNNVRVIRAVSLVLGVAFLLFRMTHTPMTDDNDSSLLSVLNENQQLVEESSLLRKPKRERPFPLESFVVAGVDLDRYERGQPTVPNQKPQTTEQPFELFDDFNIESILNGDESWHDLLKEIRRFLHKPSLAFYVDKVAMKRWLPSIGVKTPDSYIIKYKSELTNSGTVTDETNALIDLLPQKGVDYCAKPTHTSYSDGVWLVKNAVTNGNEIVRQVSQGGQSFNGRGVKHVSRAIASSLAKNLHESPRYWESWALKKVPPGVVVEERFTSFDRDDRAAMEFKVFCVWGRVFVSTWKQGVSTYGLVQRDGSVVTGGPDYNPDYSRIPKWVDWDAVVELAEKLAANKDMFRVDIFVGKPAGPTAKEQKKALIVLSECEVHPTTIMKDKRILEEAARLWLAGYKIGNYRVIPNTQVPSTYVKTGMLSLSDATMLANPNSHRLL